MSQDDGFAKTDFSVPNTSSEGTGLASELSLREGGAQSGCDVHLGSHSSTVFSS